MYVYIHVYYIYLNIPFLYNTSNYIPKFEIKGILWFGP